ncbi:hypothetical protein ACFFJT_05565 [Dyella flava]|uniref:DUF3806 domain-containing protein n=1 Tax=Dyella flava TaxID=1920170 RepID=A0ABS2K0C9_9GAMM|nr:hypothetical protein [Dyella flava]MBM7124706.1 hypothetical protein [Dyella flava]GLQ50752.1 hypothetical protein GCM10010872_22010 [Dyella flava]
MKKLFSLNWGKPEQEDVTLELAEPLDQAAAARIDSYAESVLATLRKGVPEANYGGSSVDRLAKDLTANSSRYSPDQRIQIANMYGAFLGRSIIAAYPELSGTWVRWKGDIGIEFPSRGKGPSKILFPINRTFKHIENGPADSIYDLFSAVPDFVNSNPAT